MNLSVCQSASRLVGWSVCHNFLKGRKFHFHVPIGALVNIPSATSGFPETSAAAAAVAVASAALSGSAAEVLSVASELFSLLSAEALTAALDSTFHRPRFLS